MRIAAWNDHAVPEDALPELACKETNGWPESVDSLPALADHASFHERSPGDRAVVPGRSSLRFAVGPIPLQLGLAAAGFHEVHRPARSERETQEQ
jgi:hypothetical protein